MTPHATALSDPLAVERDHLVGIAPFILGLVVVLALILGVVWGTRLIQRGDVRHGKEGPEGPEGPVEYSRERREPVEMEPDGRRYLPHELSDTGTDRAESDEPDRWSPGSSGSFGAGGPGR